MCGEGRAVLAAEKGRGRRFHCAVGHGQADQIEMFVYYQSVQFLYRLHAETCMLSCHMAAFCASLSALLCAFLASASYRTCDCSLCN